MDYKAISEVISYVAELATSEGVKTDDDCILYYIMRTICESNGKVGLYDISSEDIVAALAQHYILNKNKTPEFYIGQLVDNGFIPENIDIKVLSETKELQDVLEHAFEEMEKDYPYFYYRYENPEIVEAVLAIIGPSIDEILESFGVS